MSLLRRDAGACQASRLTYLAQHRSSSGRCITYPNRTGSSSKFWILFTPRYSSLRSPQPEPAPFSIATALPASGSSRPSAGSPARASRALFDELLRLEDDVSRAVAPAMLEAVEESPVLEPRDPLGGRLRVAEARSSPGTCHFGGLSDLDPAPQRRAIPPLFVLSARPIRRACAPHRDNHRAHHGRGNAA